MLVTKKAPDFTAKAVLADGQIVENFNLYENIGEKGAVLFVLLKLLLSQKELMNLLQEEFL